MLKSEKQLIHLEKLHEQKRKKKKLDEFQIAISYDIEFYKKANGGINISKLSRCCGLSRKYLSHRILAKRFNLAFIY